MDATKKNALQGEISDEEKASLLSKLSLHHIWRKRKDNAAAAVESGFNAVCRYPCLYDLGQDTRKFDDSATTPGSLIVSQGWLGTACTDNHGIILSHSFPCTTEYISQGYTPDLWEPTMSPRIHGLSTRTKILSLVYIC
jgi:hypothetical protein